MLFASVVETSARVSATSKRLQKVELISILLKQLEPEEVALVADYLCGRTRQGKIGLGYKAGRESTSVAATEPKLVVREIDRAFEALSEVKGTGSERQRAALLSQLMTRATPPEQDFLLRLIAGELRQGALEGIMLDAVAQASGVPSARIRRAVMNAGDLATVAGAALEQGAPGLDRFTVQLFRPVQPMLAQTAQDIAGALADLGEAALEYKMDGARIQVHRQGDEVRVYSRNLNDVTLAVPEVVEAVRAMPVHDVILDGEVIALLPNGRPQPFQITMRRFGRKLDIDRMRAAFPMQPFWFDLLHLNGGSLLDESQQSRFAELTRLSYDKSIIPNTIATTAEQAAAFMEQALVAGHEGVMAKARDSVYAAGARGQSWLKIKQPRTLDLVILAAEWGNGRRQGWLSNLHLAARNTETGGFTMLGKTFKGLTDEMLAWQTQKFLELEISRDAYTVWVQPILVAEIAFNEIQMSPRYPGGLALRFARVRRYRQDKPASSADTLETVQRMAGVPIS